MTDLEQRVLAAVALGQAATRGAWVADYGATLGHIKSVRKGAKGGVTRTPTVCIYTLGIGEPERANADLIAASHQHIGLIRDLWNEVQSLRSLAADVSDWLCRTGREGTAHQRLLEKAGADE